LTAGRLQAAVAKGEDVARRYFLFASGKEVDAEAIDLARSHGVLVVAAINTFHYPAEKNLELAAAEIARLKKLGVTHFQIDSVYEKFCSGPLRSAFFAAKMARFVGLDSSGR